MFSQMQHFQINCSAEIETDLVKQTLKNKSEIFRKSFYPFLKFNSGVLNLQTDIKTHPVSIHFQ